MAAMSAKFSPLSEKYVLIPTLNILFALIITESANETEELWKQKQNIRSPRNAQTRKYLEDELQRMKKQEQVFVKSLIKARKNEEELKRNIIRLSRELHANNRVKYQSSRLNTQNDFNLPTVFVVTPTFKRFVQKAELTRL